MAGAINTPEATRSEAPSRNYTVPMVVMTSLFFMWGVIAVMNDILIPYLKKIFELLKTSCGFGSLL